MPAAAFYTDEMASNKALILQTALAMSKVRLYKSTFVVTRTTLKASLVANEVAYDGYTAGGILITAFVGPATNPAGGVSLFSGVAYFNYNTPSSPPVTDTAGGWWIELAAGGVYCSGTLDSPQSFDLPGDALPLNIEFNEGRVATS